MRLVYAEQYNLPLGEHVFPAQKYRLIRQKLLTDGVATETGFVEPAPADLADLLLAHDAAWIDKLRFGKLSLSEAMRLEIPVSQTMLAGLWKMTGGTILAARHALESGTGFNIGGGFHHAFRAHGEGFCAVNDVAIAVRKLQADNLIRKALIVDADVHHGNGTASIFANDPDVFTFSIHQKNNYPYEKPPSTLDIDLDDLTCDAEYLQKLEAALEQLPKTPDLILYLAGADPYAEDQLGGLLLTQDGLRRRDRMILQKWPSTPIAITLAGGYAHRTQDTVAIHCNTVVEAIKRG